MYNSNQKTMKRIAIGLLCPLIGILFMTSCLGDEDETVKSSEVALLTFGIKDLKTVHTIKTEAGEDSTYTTVMSGNAVTFTIDQAQRLVYNSDSIAYGTNVTRVLVSVTADGYVYYLNENGELASVEDSIDFTSPVTFRVKSYDEQYTRDYKVSINVHQVDPEETSWAHIENTNFPILNELKAFVKGDSLYVIGTDTDGVYHTTTATLTDCTAWTTTECSGIESTGLSVLLMDDVFYLKTDLGFYRSEDAIVWTSADNEDKVSTLPGNGISRSVAWFNNPLRTNEDIMRTIFVTTPEKADTCAQVWTKLSTEENWIEIEPQGDNIYGCPNLENLAVIRYAENMYAFGGKSIGNRKVQLEPFSACYESRDNGVTWKENAAAFSLPKVFEGRTDAFSATTDGEYVWVMWNNGQVWRGRWNGIK